MKNRDSSFLGNKKVAVLMGGWSAEREISLRSGNAVLKSLKEMQINAKAIDLVSPEGSKLQLEDFDIAFIALHGRGGEDGFIQELLTDKEILFTGSKTEACKLAMNKVETKKVWREFSLPTPDFVEITKAGKSDMKITPFLSGSDDITALDKSFVVKPANEGSSYGISIVKPGEGSLEEAIIEAVKYDETVLAEAFVDGIEITVTILGDRVLPPVAIEAKGAFYDYEAKYLSNETKYSLANLDPDNLITLKNFCWHAFKSLGCEGWGRVDLIKDNNNNFQLIEINTVPGLTETSLVPKSAALEGISFNELILEILHLACAKS
jgi:D-alanine-D-alanine ligase|tara:strand:- start:653 stop:1618 length:966 start_codon:yes stop_codon:yes gene_type:complete